MSTTLSVSNARPLLLVLRAALRTERSRLDDAESREVCLRLAIESAESFNRMADGEVQLFLDFREIAMEAWDRWIAALPPGSSATIQKDPTSLWARLSDLIRARRPLTSGEKAWLMGTALQITATAPPKAP